MNALYVVAARVPRRTTITVGALGPLRFERGWYAYVGSAARAREARVARHMTAAKRLRWHADHLFAVYPATLAWLLDTELGECAVADALCAHGDSVPAARRDSGGAPTAARVSPPFGASDCDCAGHLLRLGRRPTTGALAAALADVRIRRAAAVSPQAGAPVSPTARSAPA